MLSLAKWLVFGVLTLAGVAQVVYYLRIRKFWDSLPVVAAEITYSKLDRWNDEAGKSYYDADIRFSYRFRGKQLESDTPDLRSIELFTPYTYNGSLVPRYRVGDIVNARVVPREPYVAYLEVAPLSKLSAVLMPILIAFYVLFFFGWWEFVVGGFEHNQW
jgi:hypothetical protein